MRPQLFAADNEARQVLQPLPHGASMRPQLFAADNPKHAPLWMLIAIASMRPQLFAADNGIAAASTVLRDLELQ